MSRFTVPWEHGRALVCAALAFFTGTLACAQDKYPNRVIRIVTAAPGSNHDWGARLTANELSARLPQRVIVENRGSISVEYVAKDDPMFSHPVSSQEFLGALAGEQLTDASRGYDG